MILSNVVGNETTKKKGKSKFLKVKTPLFLI